MVYRGFVTVLLALWGSAVLASGVVKVAAASDLTHVFGSLIERFQEVTEYRVEVSFGSSGNLSRQIENGAPFDIFFSADERYVDRLTDRGMTVTAGALYALGALALYRPTNSQVRLDPDLSGLADPTIKRVALANPAHAPYGRAARQALQASGLWAHLQTRLIRGESAAQATQFSFSGNVDAGLIPHSLAVTPAVAARGESVTVSAALYEPLRQKMVVLKPATDGAVALFEYMLGAEAGKILSAHGFQRP